MPLIPIILKYYLPGTYFSNLIQTINPAMADIASWKQIIHFKKLSMFDIIWYSHIRHFSNKTYEDKGITVRDETYIHTHKYKVLT